MGICLSHLGLFLSGLTLYSFLSMIEGKRKEPGKASWVPVLSLADQVTVLNALCVVVSSINMETTVFALQGDCQDETVNIQNTEQVPDTNEKQTKAWQVVFATNYPQGFPSPAQVASSKLPYLCL